MKIALYQKCPDGRVLYRGAREWKSVGALVKSLYPKGDYPEENYEPCSDRSVPTEVTWIGIWGYLRQAPLLKIRAVNLTDEQVEIAKVLGEGNISEGVRRALAAFQ